MQEKFDKPRDSWSDEEIVEVFGQIAMKIGKPYFIGKLQRTDWTGRIRTYLIWCPPCKIRPNRGFTVAHEAGRERRLECGYCRTRYDHLLLRRKVVDMIANPHRYPSLILFMFFVTIVAALALR